MENVTLSHPSRWDLDIGALELNSVCLSKLPQSAPSTVAPKTLAQWQAILPNTWLTIHRFTLSPWQQWEGELHASLTPARQDIIYNGKQVSIKGQLRGQTLSISQFDVQLPDQPQPVKLVGEFTLPLVPDGVPVKGIRSRPLTCHSYPRWSMPIWTGRTIRASWWSWRGTTPIRCSIYRGRSPLSS